MTRPSKIIPTEKIFRGAYCLESNDIIFRGILGDYKLKLTHLLLSCKRRSDRFIMRRIRVPRKDKFSVGGWTNHVHVSA